MQQGRGEWCSQKDFWSQRPSNLLKALDEYKNIATYIHSLITEIPVCIVFLCSKEWKWRNKPSKQISSGLFFNLSRFCCLPRSTGIIRMWRLQLETQKPSEFRIFPSRLNLAFPLLPKGLYIILKPKQKSLFAWRKSNLHRFVWFRL